MPLGLFARLLMTQNVFRSGPLNVIQDIYINTGDMHYVLNASVFPLTLFTPLSLQNGGVVQSYVDGCCRTCESPNLLGASGNALSCQ